MFAQVNRNKRSMAIDLKRADGQAIVRRLARDGDVVVENFRPGVTERLNWLRRARRSNPQTDLCGHQRLRSGRSIS